MKLPILALTIVFASVQTASSKTVVVQSGDTLSEIAKKELGSEAIWPAICELNKDVLENCNRLRVGQELKLPDAEASEPAMKAETTSEPAVETMAEKEMDKEAEPAKEDMAAKEPEKKEVPAEPVAEEKPVEAKAETSHEDPSSEPALTETMPERVNLVAEPLALESDYWQGYWLKPKVQQGVSDPMGGMDAIRIESADGGPREQDSGFVRKETLLAGIYTTGVWLRSTSGKIVFEVGISDEHKTNVEVGEEWKLVTQTFDMIGDADRLFQIVERMPNNPAWEIYGVSVEKGKFTSPLYGKK